MTVIEAQSTAAVEPTLDNLADTITELRYVGLEFEYPVALEEAPAGPIDTSDALRSEYGTGNRWLDEVDDVAPGTMTGDHVGAEIRSAPMVLHTTQPEVWYEASIAKAEALGHPFGACGNHDSTTFGLHTNLSPLRPEKAEALYHMVVNEPWADVFFHASVNGDGADPWRHGGHEIPGERSFEMSSIITSKRDTFIDYDNSIGNYYEFRTPEPGLPEHVSMIMHFLRLLDIEGPEAAADYAREKVYEANPALTPVRQYQELSQDERWFERAFDENRHNRREIAEFMGEIMGDL